MNDILRPTKVVRVSELMYEIGCSSLFILIHLSDEHVEISQNIYQNIMMANQPYRNLPLRIIIGVDPPTEDADCDDIFYEIRYYEHYIATISKNTDGYYKLIKAITSNELTQVILSSKWLR